MSKYYETMSIIGGIETYILFLTDPPKQRRHKSDKSPFGRIVYFLNKNGYDIERELANKIFKKGQALTVKEIYVDRSSSKVEFLEFPNQQFNTVMFTDEKMEIN